MALELLSTAPQPADFTTLEEHQSATPGTFFGGKPVLHAHQTGLTLAVPRDQLSLSPGIERFTANSSQDGSTVDGPSEKPAPALIEGVDVWVGSERLVIFQSSPKPHGIAISYPAIGIQALQRFQGVQSLHMQINLNAQDANREADEEADFEILIVNLLPPKDTSEVSSGDPNADHPIIKELYDACATCQELHPDPYNEDDEDAGEGGLPGEGGWITSENMDQFIDADGNFIGGGRLGEGNVPVFGGEEGESLGVGAGHVRPRDEVEGINDNDIEDQEGTNGETKWRRTE